MGELHTNKQAGVLTQTQHGYPIGTLMGTPFGQAAGGTRMRRMRIVEGGGRVFRTRHVRLGRGGKVTGRQTGRHEGIVVLARIFVESRSVGHEI